MPGSVDKRLLALAEEYDLPARAPDQLREVLTLLRLEHSSVSSVRDPRDAVERHVEDSLTGLRIEGLRASPSIADLGSGGGFPGLVLALALPDVPVTLVESVSRKCAFLERAAAAAGLSNVDVLCARAEELDARRFGAVTARALAPLPVLVEYAAPILDQGGIAVFWKGSPERQEIRAGEHAAGVLGLRQQPSPALPVAASGQDRKLLVYRKVEPTPPGYPRRAGVARKRPLAG